MVLQGGLEPPEYGAVRRIPLYPLRSKNASRFGVEGSSICNRKDEGIGQSLSLRLWCSRGDSNPPEYGAVRRIPLYPLRSKNASRFGVGGSSVCNRKDEGIGQRPIPLPLVLQGGLEPPTPCLKGRCSTA